MSRRKIGFLVAAAALFVAMMSADATAGHDRNISDGTNPNSTVYMGQTCSADVITPTGYAINIGDYRYLLRYSANCRSVWGRTASTAPRRNDMVTHRHVDSHTSGYCTGTRRFSDGVNFWTAQVDDADHLSNIHINYAGWDDCVASHAQYDTNLF